MTPLPQPSTDLWTNEAVLHRTSLAGARSLATSALLYVILCLFWGIVLGAALASLQ